MALYQGGTAIPPSTPPHGLSKADLAREVAVIWERILWVSWALCEHEDEPGRLVQIEGCWLPVDQLREVRASLWQALDELLVAPIGVSRAREIERAE